MQASDICRTLALRCVGLLHVKASVRCCKRKFVGGCFNRLDLEFYAGFLLMGDFYINWSANSSSGLKDILQNLADAFCFEQLVFEITRSSTD